MKLLIISDVHGNLVALETLLAKEAGHYDQLVSLGDVVNYGPWSNECVELLEDKKSIVIIGNHELFFLEGECSSSSAVCKSSFEVIYPTFKYFSLIKEYQDIAVMFDHTFVHTIEDKYIYQDSLISFSENYFIGHSHRQFVLKDGRCKLYNVGSVGQNRIDIEIINYSVFDTTKKTVELKSLIYDIDKLLSEFEAKGFPDVIVNYYKSKLK